MICVEENAKFFFMYECNFDCMYIDFNLYNGIRKLIDRFNFSLYVTIIKL